MSKAGKFPRFIVFNRELGVRTDLPIEHHVEGFQEEICVAEDSVLGVYTRVMLSEIDYVVFGEGVH